MKHFASLLLLVLCAVPLSAQEATFSIGGRGNIAIPTGDIDDANVGYGFDLEAVVGLTPVVGIYGSYNYFSFGVDTEDEGFDSDMVDRGFGFGGQLMIPMADARVQPWIRAGAIYNVTEVGATGDGVSASFESDRALGFEIGGGLDFPVGDAVVAQPYVRYRTHSIEFDAIPDAEGDVSYITIGIGVAFSL